MFINHTGQIIRKYHIKTKVTETLHGAVYQANNTETDELVAVKMLSVADLPDEKAITRFKMEAVISFRLRHPFIVPLLDYWSDEEAVWLATKWMEGGSLRQNIPMSADKVLHMLERLTHALGKAHMHKVIHRDLKPDNILFDENGNAYLTDFGIAKRTNVEDITAPDATIGSPAYYTPEQILKQPITPQTDIYALGFVLYEAITGVHPYGDTAKSMQVILNHLHNDCPPITQHSPDLPKAMDDVFATAMQKEPEKRFETIQAFCDAFRNALVS